jgi:hypothetical protein
MGPVWYDWPGPVAPGVGLTGRAVCTMDRLERRSGENAMVVGTGIMMVGLALGEMPDPGARDRPIAVLAQRTPARSGSRPSVKWLGQDGHDFVSLWLGKQEPSEIQDIHLALTGLPPDREITRVVVAAAGGNEWEVNGPKTFYPAVLKRSPRSTSADLYIEPVRVETGRLFHVSLTYDNGQTIELRLQGKKADPKVRMPNVSLAAKWVGQERQDWVGGGPSVGPDGLQDARIALSRLSPKNEVNSARLEGPSGARWEFGRNPKAHPNAELVRDTKDPLQADFYIHPDRDLSGQKLKLTINYADGKTDSTVVTAGRTDPKLRMPPPALPTLITHATTGRWIGQDNTPGVGAGDVHLALSGLPTGSILAAVLSDSVRGCWVAKMSDRPHLETEPGSLPLTFRRGTDRSRADLFFAPYRNESDATFTLRLVLQEDEMAIVQFPGGACNPDLKAPDVAPGTVVAKPGDDLNDLTNRFGTVKLTKGTYPLSRPLVLNQSVTLTGEPGAMLLFSQGAGEPPWPDAIKIHRSRTTLEGFTIRFAGPIRWKEDTPWGPALIGATEIYDNSHPDPRANLTFSKLDIETPPAANPASWVEAPRIMRLVNSRSGRIVGNTLRGGPIELLEGPWQVLDNDFRGTVPGTWSPGVFTAHSAYDLVVRGNRAKSVGPSGKTWRFLVLTGGGFNNRVENNTVEGIGPRDDDTIGGMNMPEVILTESYRIQFEGKPAAVSSDGRIVRVNQTHGEPVRTGDQVAVVAGTSAGHWRRIAQAINPTTFLLDSPLPPPSGTEAISITRGFVNALLQGNTIDARGGSKAANLVLPGNHFGLRLINNRLIGAGDSFRITSYATESPGFWGWSHVPFFGCVVEGNTFEDSEQGGQIQVEHSQWTKSNKGRLYMVITLRNNTFRWTESFLSQRASKGAKDLPPALRIGVVPSLDPGELFVYEQENTLQAPAGVRPTAPVKVIAALINGKRFVDQSLPLPTGLAFPSTPARSNSAPRAGQPAEPRRAAQTGVGRAGATAR